MIGGTTSDVDAEFAALITERIIAYQQQAAWTAAKAREYAGTFIAVGLTYHAVRARAYQIESEVAAMRAGYWLQILIDGSY